MNCAKTPPSGGHGEKARQSGDNKNRNVFNQPPLGCGRDQFDESFNVEDLPQVYDNGKRAVSNPTPNKENRCVDDVAQDNKNCVKPY